MLASQAEEISSKYASNYYDGLMKIEENGK